MGGWPAGRIPPKDSSHDPIKSLLSLSKPLLLLDLLSPGHPGRQVFLPEAGEFVFLGDISFSERNRELQRNSSKASSPVGTVCLFLFLSGSFTKPSSHIHQAGSCLRASDLGLRPPEWCLSLFPAAGPSQSTPLPPRQRRTTLSSSRRKYHQLLSPDLFWHFQPHQLGATN